MCRKASNTHAEQRGGVEEANRLGRKLCVRWQLDYNCDGYNMSLNHKYGESQNKNKRNSINMSYNVASLSALPKRT